MFSHPQPTPGLSRFEPPMDRNRPLIRQIRPAEDLQERREVRGQPGPSFLARRLGEGRPLTSPTEGRVGDQYLKELPSNEAIARSIKDARQTIIDLTGSDKIELGKPNKPIVIDLENSPPSTPRRDSSRPNESVHAEIAALRKILESGHSNPTHDDIKSAVGEAELSAKLALAAKSGIPADRRSPECPNSPNGFNVRDSEPTKQVRSAYRKASSLLTPHSRQNENLLGSENGQPWQGHKTLSSPSNHATGQEHLRPKETELANPWRVSDRTLSRLSSHSNSAVGARSGSPSSVSASTSGATRLIVDGEKPLRASIREQDGHTNEAEQREQEDLLNGSYAVTDDEEGDWHKSTHENTKKGRYGLQDGHSGPASADITTEISPDGMKSLIRDLVSEMAKEQVSRIKGLLSEAQTAAQNPERNMWSPVSNSSNDRATTTTTQLADHLTTVSPLAQFGPRQRANPDVQMPRLKLELEVFESERQSEDVEVRFNVYSSREAVVPKYKCYTASRNNILSGDDDILRYMPYFDEREPENMGSLLAHFKDVVKVLPLKYRRDERAKRLLSVAHKALERCGCSVDDAIHCIVEATTSVQADHELKMEVTLTEAVNGEDPRRAKLIAGVGPRKEQRVLVAREVCKAFFEVTGVTMWEVIKRDLRVSKLLMHGKLGKITNFQNRDARDQGPHSKLSPLAPYTTLGCNVCFMHECSSHGGFDNGKVRRRFAGIPHQNVPILSRPMQTTSNGQESGARGFTELYQEKPCSESCFMRGNTNNSNMPSWSDADLELLRSTLPAWSNCKTAACTYSAVLGKPCVDVYTELCKILASTSSEDVTTINGVSGTTQKKLSGTPIDWAETKTHRHDKRNLFIPCNHPGPCIKNVCSCADEDVACEKSCLCSGTCRRRYQGCSCGKKAKPCRTDRCECVALNRECEPDLCSGCGAVEALDPKHRYEDNILGHTCGNVNLQRGVPKRTLLGISEVEGYGLFMGEAVKAKQYLGEYVGELISAAEAERRGAIYDLQQLSYLFAVNNEQEVDATRIGNKFRFVNHSSLARNCSPKVLFVNGVHRIAIFSTRDIEVGEELFFDYGPQYHTSFLSKEPKGKKSVARTTSSFRGDEVEVSAQAQDSSATSKMPPESKRQISRRRQNLAGRKRSGNTDEHTKRRPLRTRIQNQETMSSITESPRRGERTQRPPRKRKTNRESSPSKPASKHQLREQTIAERWPSEHATSASDTDEEEDQTERDHEGNASLPDTSLIDAAARDGASSDEEYAEDDVDEDDDTVVEERQPRRGLRHRKLKLVPRLRRSGRLQ